MTARDDEWSLKLQVQQLRSIFHLMIFLIEPIKILHLIVKSFSRFTWNLSKTGFIFIQDESNMYCQELSCFFLFLFYLGYCQWISVNHVWPLLLFLLRNTLNSWVTLWIWDHLTHIHTVTGQCPHVGAESPSCDMCTLQTTGQIFLEVRLQHHPLPL